MVDFFFRRTYRGPVKAVILDWAGTTVDYGSFAPTAVFLNLFASRGIQITPEDARSGMGLMKKDHLRTILARPGVVNSWTAEFGKPASEEDIDKLFVDFVPMQLAVLKEYAQPIPGCIETIKDLRRRGIKIGTTTGYIRSMMAILGPEAATLGYEPDCIVCPDDAPAGRPYPWMMYQNAIQLGVYPIQAFVKVGDTPVDIEEGLNAGAWTVGLTQTGNLMGLTQQEVDTLKPEQKSSFNERIGRQFTQAGAHLVIDGIWDLPSAIDNIEDRLFHGEQP